MTSSTQQQPISPEHVAQTMWHNDSASKHLGMELVSVGWGSSHLKMTVQTFMLNGFATCHGGYITLLADSAFAFACNSHNRVTVASGLDIDFVSAAHEGDVLFAQGTELSRTRRTGLYEITVRNQRDELVAVMRGRAFIMADKFIIPPETHVN